MSSLVSEFLINPVLRQARRFSSGFAPEYPTDANAETDRIQLSFDPSSSSTSAPNHPSLTSWSENAVVVDNQHPRRVGTVLATAAGLSGRSPPPPTPLSPDPEGLLHVLGGTGEANANRRGAWTAVDPLGSSPAALEEVEMVAREEEEGVVARLELLAPAEEEMVERILAADHIASASKVLPEDDGMRVLRRRILAIQSRDLPPGEKARMMHQLLMEGYTRSQVAVIAEKAALTLDRRPASAEQELATGPLEGFKFWNPMGDGVGALKVSLTEEDLRPTFVPPSEDDDNRDGDGDAGVRKLGCEHYRRNVKMQCAICERWYTCRFCHDAAEDHKLPRRETKNMLCMLCGCAQRVGDACIKCGEMAARYYCGVCKLWNDDPDKPIYHCNDCGICRVGQGLGRDFVHCNKCTACIAISISETHKCIERSTDCDCPICGDNMFSSVKRVIFMQCGHTIHDACYREHLKTSYRCPICNRSVVNMEIQFRNYDAAIQNQPMPHEYRDARAIVSCNDCSAKSQTAYHWLGLRCSICQSYNTVALQLLDLPSNALSSPVSSPAAALGVGGGASASQGLGILSAPVLVAAPEGQLAPALQPVLARGIPTASVQNRPETSDGPHDQDMPTFSPYLVSERMARSVSPIPLPSAVQIPEDSEEDELGDPREFWGGDVLGNILSSGPEDEGQSGEDSESGSDSEAEDDADLDDEEDEDEDKEERINLFGHR